MATIVDYQTLQAAQNEISRECDTMQTLANNMNTSIDVNFGTGGEALDSSAGETFKTEWETFANESFPRARKDLETVIDVQLQTWYDSFEQAERKIINESKNIQ